jgi:hypothetical protein
MVHRAEALVPGDLLATPLAPPHRATHAIPLEKPRPPCSVQLEEAAPHAAINSAPATSVSRPDLSFQEALLHDCFSTAAPEFLGIPLPEPGALWLMPSISSSTFNLNANQVSNILSFCLAAPPVFLKARSCRPFVFMATVPRRM